MAVSIIEPVVFYVHDNHPAPPLRAPPVEPCPDPMGRPGRDRPSRRQSALRVRRRLSGPGLVPLRRHGRGHALSLAFSAFVDPGDPIICEAPTFSGSLNNIRRHGPEILDAPVDADGMVTRVVRERLEGLKRQGRRCKLIYTIVNFQNPAGPDLSLPRRQELVQLAEEHDTFILEDDAYGELRFEGEPKPPVYALDRSGREIRGGTPS